MALENSSKKIIGFSTGDLYRSPISMAEMAELYYSCGANAIELSFGTPEEINNFAITNRFIKAVEKFAFISIHSPWKEGGYDNSKETQKILDKLKSLCAVLPIKGIVMHPDTIKDMEILKKSGLPFLLENMDSHKKFGKSLADFAELKKRCDFGFVLDLQHAYEHDQAMKLAKDLAEIMGNRLSHLHVSGESDSENHVPVHLARNREAIAGVIKFMPPVPIILEGAFLEDDLENTIKNELSFIKNYEK
jgi:hypothetical protein